LSVCTFLKYKDIQMKKNTLVVMLLFLFSLNPVGLFARNDSILYKIISKVPHQISVEFGYRNSFYKNTYLTNTGKYYDSNNPNLNNDLSNPQVLNSATNGVGILADYAWQLSGLNGKKPAVYLTIPMGYTILLPDNSTSKRVSMLNYGWTIRHELATNDKKIVPFVGYGLFLNNLSMGGVHGSVSGHQTQFEGGVNLNTATHLKYFVKLQVSYSSYPKLDYNKSLHFMYTDFRVGVRF
jgi:hypothetical protein